MMKPSDNVFMYVCMCVRWNMPYQPASPHSVVIIKGKLLSNYEVYL